MSGSQAVAMLVAAVGCSLGTVSAYGDGAPTSQCTDMMPSHGAQGSGSQYAIDLESSVTTYSHGTAITVTITGAAYQGLILQARSTDGSTTPVGTFSASPANTKLITCSASDDTVTHSSTAEKDSVAYTWNPPAQSHGDIQFIATVAETKHAWWMDVRSIELSADVCVNTGQSTFTAALIGLMVLLAICLGGLIALAVNIFRQRKLMAATEKELLKLRTQLRKPKRREGTAITGTGFEPAGNRHYVNIENNVYDVLQD